MNTIKAKEILSLLKVKKCINFINVWRNQPIYSFQSFGFGKRNKPKQFFNPLYKKIAKRFANNTKVLVAERNDDYTTTNKPYTIICQMKEIKL